MNHLTRTHMASIAIIGSGFVGQANGKVLARQGHHVLFVDVDARKLAALEKEKYHVGTYEDLALEKNIDIIFLSVPTPTINNQIDLSSIKKAAKNLGSFLHSQGSHPVIVLKSTVPPGTTKDLLIPLLEKHSQKKVIDDFSVTFEPEYLREATSLEDAASPRVITIGSLPEDEYGSSVLAWLRSAFHVPIFRVSLEEAEIQKYAHNLFNATKISFFNEMREVCRQFDADPEKVFTITAKTAEASWNPHYGLRDLGPFDGSCLPKDTAGFLAFIQQKLGIELPLLKAVIEVNNRLADKKAAPSPVPAIPQQTYEYRDTQ